jgi:hypothetical protein
MCVLWSNPNRKQKGQHREHHFRRRLKIGDEEFRETADAESSERKDLKSIDANSSGTMELIPVFVSRSSFSRARFHKHLAVCHLQVKGHLGTL